MMTPLVNFARLFTTYLLVSLPTLPIFARNDAFTPPRSGVRGGRSGFAAPRAEFAPSAPSTGIVAFAGVIFTLAAWSDFVAREMGPLQTDIWPELSPRPHFKNVE